MGGLGGDGRGNEGATLDTPTASLAGEVAVRVGAVEISALGLGAVTDRSGGGASAGAAGLRLRATPLYEPDHAFHLGLAFDLGVRWGYAALGRSEICGVVPSDGGRWTREPDTDCYSTDLVRGEVERLAHPHVGVTLYPTFRVTDDFFFYAGAGVSWAAVGYTNEAIYEVYEGGYGRPIEETDTVDTRLAVTGIFGAECAIDDNFSLLIGGRSPALFSGVDLGGASAEAALSMRF